jgi:hypothetical protein
MIPKITQQKLDAIAQKYAARLLADVKAVLNTPQYKNSGELESSLKILVVPATDLEAPKIILTYADQGFYLGYKNPQWTKVPDIEKLKKWAETKVTDLGDIPGYEYGTASRLPIEKQKERIVWAIAKNKRKEDTWKPRKWKNAAKLGNLLSDLNVDTLSAYAKDVENLLADAISKGTAVS